MEMNLLGGRIAALRKARGMTQKELAESLHISDKSVSRWERGETAPDLSLLPALAEQLDVSLDELLSGRKPALQTAAPSEAFSAGLICRSMRAQGICTILAAALSLLGLAGLFILRYEYLNPSAGAFCAGIFLIFSAALESASFFWTQGILRETRASQTAADAHGKTLLRRLFGISILNVAIAAASLALYLRSIGGAIQRLWSWSEILAPTLGAALALLLLLSLLLPRWALKKGLLSESCRASVQANTRKKLFCIGGCAAALAVTLLTGHLFSTHVLTLERICGEGTCFASFDDFKAFAETPVSVYADGRMVEILLEDGTTQYYEDRNRDRWFWDAITDAQGNTMTYIRRNLSIAAILHEPGAEWPFRVYTAADQAQYNRVKETARVILGALLLLEISAGFLLYFRIREQ